MSNSPQRSNFRIQWKDIKQVIHAEQMKKKQQKYMLEPLENNEFKLKYAECINVVSGYCKMLHNNIYYIPIEIIQIILFYFYDTFKFNLYNHGAGFEFINNQTVTKINSQTATCVFGEEISNKKCKGFDLYIEWKCCVEAFFMGYITSTLEASIKESKHFLGHGLNKQHSVGIEVYKEYNNFTLSDKKNNYKMLNYAARENFKQGDVFRLCFNFKDKQLVIYHNGFKADTLSLQYKQLTPAISLRYKGETIEIIKCGLILYD